MIREQVNLLIIIGICVLISLTYTLLLYSLNINLTISSFAGMILSLILGLIVGRYND